MDGVTDKNGQFLVGTKFVGNVNNVQMQIIAIKSPWEGCQYEGVLKPSPRAYIRNLETGKISRYGLRALEHCDVTIITENEN